MANSDTRFGLRPVKHLDGTPYNGGHKKYYMPSDYATSVFIGDCVTTVGDANDNEVTTGAGKYGARTLHEVNRTSPGDGNAITGVVVGFDPNPSNLDRIYGAASTERVVHVADNPNLLFEIQADGSLTADNVGLNAVLIDTHAGSTVTGLSGTELDTTSDVPDADASNQLTIYSIVDRPDNDPASANVKALVRINNHTNAHGVIGVA
jgi:hypothetical protein